MAVEILHSGVYPREKRMSQKDLYKNVYNSFIYNNPKLEVAQVSRRVVCSVQ